MKRKIKNSLILSIIVVLGISCKDEYFEKNPPGAVVGAQINTKAGAESLLIGAYSLLDAVGASTTSYFGNGNTWQASEQNWIQGDLQSDDGVKGGANNGNEAYMTEIELYNAQPTNVSVIRKWEAVYDGISRCNDVLKAVAAAKDVDAASFKRITAEARFLRGHYHADAVKIYGKVPYIDETLLDTRIPNDKDIYPNIEADFEYAINNLPETQPEVGRVNKWAAMAYLAKIYIFQKKFSEAKPLLDDIIANGKTSNNKKYDLEACYDDNFNADTKNGKESVFALQASTNDGVTGENGRFGDVLNAPLFGPFCCAFFMATHNLVNSFKTDAVTGLPLLDTFNDVDLKNDEKIKSDVPFTPSTEALDPRVDFTVGRRGIPYNGWGLNEGYKWINGPEYAGPYLGKKWVMRKIQEGVLNEKSGPGWLIPANYIFIRFADVLLWRAEVAIESNDLPTALTYINQVRNRVKTGCVVKLDDGTSAANYNVGLYPSFPDKAYALKALQFERRLEFGMEGHRFYDLVRWGIADQVINKFVSEEKAYRIYKSGAVFVKGKNELLPIPQSEITNSYKDGKPTLIQNPGYN